MEELAGELRQMKGVDELLGWPAAQFLEQGELGQEMTGLLSQKLGLLEQQEHHQ